jgi:hypothetical protein
MLCNFLEMHWLLPIKVCHETRNADGDADGDAVGVVQGFLQQPK